MSGDFNPYREWLGLELNAAPSYYELLSLAPFASDAAQIASAAERARTRVRSFRPGPNAQAWSQLLDDIQAAKECLCDSARKAEYDDRLRGQQATQFVHSAIEPAIDSATAPASVLAPLQSELYPPGMARPVGAPQAALASVQVPAAAAVPRPRSDLDPPVRGAATTAQAESATRTAEAVPAYMLPTPAMPQPIAATPTYYQSETATTANSWVAGPSPIYDATAAGGYADLPLALPVSAAPYAAGVDPMAPVSVAGLLPPGAAEGDAVASAQPIPEAAISTAPSAAQLFSQRDRQARWGLALVALCGIALVAAVGVTYFLVLKHAPPIGDVAANDPPEVMEMPPRAATGSAQRTDAKDSTAPSPVSKSLPPTDAPPLPARRDPAPLPRAPQTAPTVAAVPGAAPPMPVSPPPGPTREELQELVKALDTAKAALAEQDFSVAQTQLAKAESLARQPKHQEAVSRLREIGGYVKQFRQAIDAAVAGMQAGESFKVGNSTQVSFVEGSADKVVLRIAGMNRTYPLNDLPPGLALAMADFKLAVSDPVSRVLKGAYLLVHKRGDQTERDKALALWQEAQRMGANVSHLTPFLNDNYAAWLNEAP